MDAPNAAPSKQACRYCYFNTWRFYTLISPFTGGQCGCEKSKSWKQWCPINTHTCDQFLEGEFKIYRQGDCYDWA